MANKINLKKIIGNNAHWTINKTIARQIGLAETLVLQHIIDLESVFKRTEIFQPIPEMAEELCLSEYSVKQAIGKLKSLDLVRVERKSVGFKNFYSVNEEKVMEFISGSGQLASELNSTGQRVEGVSELNSIPQRVENTITSEMNSTLSEVNSVSQRVENAIAITNNTTNNTLQKIYPKNTTAAPDESLENITDKILNILIDSDSDDKEYNNAIEDYNELGAIDGIAKIMCWDDSAKSNWLKKIINVNAIKTN
jgi:DNA-binding transcriptional regulator GbsR (MarR family)